ncbi:MAG: nucleotide exchange factor GrpE [Akkermansiaceae bacterium]|nr:nucleotide exchange factor GrpE [Akkermansiaceae bacterium]
MYNIRMKEDMNEKDLNQDNCTAEDCCCEEETKTQAEHAEAVNESDAAEADAAVDELTKWREMAMRTAAEYDNYRKRCVKEREEFCRYANKGLLEELLPVIDNFEMGMMMAGQDTSSMIYIGMSMVQKQLEAFLSSQGVEAIPTEVGQAFDHNIHEAIQSEVSDKPEGTILRVLRRGYNLKGRLLRPANVIVAAPAEEKEA